MNMNRHDQALLASVSESIGMAANVRDVDRTNIDVLPLTLDEGAEKFITRVKANFSETSAKLRQLANEFRKAAEVADQKADQLDGAAPDLSEQVKDWVSFETQAHMFVKFYEPIFKK